MALSTYAALVSAVTEWLARDGDATLIARVPDFITLAEAKLNRELRVNQMEKRSTTDIDTTSDEPEFVTLPTDFQAMRRIRLSSVEGKPSLEFLSQTQMADYRTCRDNVSGQPLFYSIVGDELELAPTPNEDYTLEMVYRATIPALTASNTTNWLLTMAPDVYLYGALLESAPYIHEDERLAVWGAAFGAVIEQINLNGARQSIDAGPSTISLPGVNP